jgi:predicted glycoside hydrolase/deacetylase ChbG (UPF0249 family)
VAEGSKGKRLIVTGDDFGITPGINLGIIEAHRNGILTSASLVVPGEAFEDAVERFRNYPTLGVGLHLTLTRERPVLHANQVPSLVGSDGRLPRNAFAFVRRYLSGRIAPVEVERELRAQCEKALDANLVLSYLDGHEHIHMWPPILPIALSLAEEYHIQGIRYPREAIDTKRFRLRGRGFVEHGL